MAGIHSETTLEGCVGGLDKGGHGSFGVGGIKVGIRLGVKLYAVGPGLGGKTYVVNVGADKYRRTYAGLAQTLHYRGEKLHVGGYVPSGTRSECVGRVGHECHLGGSHLEHKLHKLGRGITLDVKLGAYQRTQFVDVIAPDVTLVGTGMHGNTLRAKGLTVGGHFEQIGHILTARVAQGGYFVDINA